MQVVFAQERSADFDLPPFELYKSLRKLNPSPYMFFLDFGDYQLVGSSPEILVRLLDGEVTIRPIAGTRPRGKNTKEDKKLTNELLRRLNEVVLTTDTFSAAKNVQALAKDAINSAIREILQDGHLKRFLRLF